MKRVSESAPAIKIRITKTQRRLGEESTPYLLLFLFFKTKVKAAALIFIAPPSPCSRRFGGRIRVIYFALFGVGVHMFFNSVAEGRPCLELISTFAHSL